MAADVTFDLYEENEIRIASTGTDGSMRIIDRLADGTLLTSEYDGVDWLQQVSGTGGSERVRVRGFDFMSTVYDEWFLAAMGEDFTQRPWQVGVQKAPVDHAWDPRSTGDTEVVISRSIDDEGHIWERGHRPEVRTDKAVVPARDWLKSYHPAHGSDPASSTEWGTTQAPDGMKGAVGQEHYTTTTTHVSSSQGEYTVVVGDSYNPTTGVHETSAEVTQPDGSVYKASETRRPDGSKEEIRTSIPPDGPGTREVTTTTKDGTTSTRTEEVKKSSGEGGGKDDEDGKGKGGDPEPDPEEEKGSPTGEDDPGAGDNPDGPFSGQDPISLAKLIGTKPHDFDEGDTLGDLERRMGPWSAQTLRAALSLVGGKDPAEVLDTLGAPPVVGFDLHGVVDDELKDYDSTGRPPRFGGGHISRSAIEGAEFDATTAASAASMLLALDKIATTAAPGPVTRDG